MFMDRTKAYKEAGVDIEKGNLLVERIKNIVTSTKRAGMLSDLGGFGGLFKLNLDEIKQPVLVSATDGVGTKLKLAIEFGVHHTVGIDLVAMSVNDVLVQGAKPLFFLDYFATSCLDVDTAEQVIAGIGQGCKQAECVLLGGETAEMPDFYAQGEYDLAGFCVGLVDYEQVIDGSQIRKGDCVLGLASTGLHANGFSLVRKILKSSGLKKEDLFPGTDKQVWEVLLEPTQIYVRPILNLLRELKINGMVHITGGGFYENIPRVIPLGLKAKIDFKSFPKPAVFEWIKQEANLAWEEMASIFNCGVGYVLIVDPEVKEDVLLRMQAQGIESWEIGRIELAQNEHESKVEVKY